MLNRFGTNVHIPGDYLKSLSTYDHETLKFGWYINYSYAKPAASPADMKFAHMVRFKHFVRIPEFEALLRTEIAADPGGLWLVGNEPDVAGQDGVYASGAEAFAAFYHRAYTFIKAHDPSAQIAMAAVVQPSPLRLRFLDQILAEYELQFGTKLPFDLMNTHNFLMSEHTVSEGGITLWGNGVPPGMDKNDPDARYLPPEEHWNVALFKQRIIDMRTWMNANGYREKPLIVSEFGILLPDGWDLTGVGTATFMTESLDFLLNAKDDSLGYPEDENRLVQSFAWFSLNYPAYDPSTGAGLNGAFFEFEGGKMTALGETYRDYVNNFIPECNPEGTPTPEVTVAPTGVLTSTMTPTPTPTFSPTPTATPTSTPTATPTSRPREPEYNVYLPRL